MQPSVCRDSFESLRFALRMPSAAACLALALATAAPAQEGPGLEQDLETARTQMRESRWAKGAEAFLSLFERHAGSPEVIRRLAEIEPDLKYCLFRSKAREAKAADLFGEAVKSLDLRTGRISLSYPGGPVKPDWNGTPGEDGVLRIPFEGDISVEFTVNCRAERSNFYAPFATLCLDAEGKSGYRLYPGFYVQESTLTGYSVYSDDARVVRLDAGRGEQDLVRDKESSQSRRDFALKCRAHRKGSTLTVMADGKVRATASDGKYTGGFVAVSGARVWGVEIHGTVRESHLRSVKEAWMEKEFAAWTSRSWDRTAVLPAWALRPAGSGTGPLDPLLPGAVPLPLPPPLGKAMDAWSRGDRTRFLSLSAGLLGLPPLTASYVHALRDLALGRLARARDALDRILEEEPSCAGALLHRGIIRLDLRESKGAAADLNAARRGAGSVPALHEALASLAIQQGDMEAAQAHLLGARTAGALSPGIERLAGWIQRSRDGPPWPRKFEVATRTATVASDHSVELSREVAGLLEQSFAAFLREIPGTTSPDAPLQVLVFRLEDDYLRHAVDLGGDPRGPSDGAYHPVVRTMLLLAQDPASGEKFRATVRREALHAFLDGNLKGAPPWFVEGFARRFEFVLKVGEGPGPRPLHPVAEAVFRGRAGAPPTPLRTLLLLNPATYLEQPEDHDADSWAFIDYLLETRSPPGRTLVAEYLRSLRSGLSGEEAFRKHFEPDLPVLERGFASWVEERIPR